MRFYVASRLDNVNEVRWLISVLTLAHGHSCTYDWTVHSSVKGDRNRMVEISTFEINAVREADFVVVVLPGGRGTHVELGAALALGKQVYLVGPRRTTCAFYFHLCVKRVRSVEALIRLLSSCGPNCVGNCVGTACGS